MKYAVLPLLSVFLLLSALLLPAHADEIDDFVTAQMEKQHIPGLSLAVVREGKIVKVEGYGLASLELGAPVSPTTVYEIGSLTKQFTATLILMLVESGKIRLDDPISKYLAGTPKAWAKVTVRNLLNHTSGIKNYTAIPGFPLDTTRPIGPSGMIPYVAKYPLDFAPGSRYTYSNTGYFLLGMIIEKVTGKPYAAFLTERILTPLQMTATRVNDPDAIVPNRARGYTHVDGATRNAGYIDMSWPFSAGALLTTVVDLARWDAALYTETLVKKSTLEQMWTPPALLAGAAPSHYGFGWEIGSTKGHRLIEHGGGIPGFAAHIARYVDDKVTVIVLTNADDASPEKIAYGVIGFYIPSLSAAPEKPIPDTEPQVTALLRGVLTKIAAGTGDPTLFTPELWKLMQQAMQNPAGYKALGEIQSIDLLQHGASDAVGVRTYRYRVNYTKAEVIVEMVLDKAGKISDLDVKAE